MVDDRQRTFMNKHLKTAIYLSKLLDSKFKVLGFKFGIDPLLGLLPGGGDLVSFVLALYLVWVGIDMKLPKDKMGFLIKNVVLDFGIGLIPIFGDVWDFVFKANDKNLKILKQHHEENIIEVEVVE